MAKTLFQTMFRKPGRNVSQQSENPEDLQPPGLTFVSLWFLLPHGGLPETVSPKNF